MDQLIFVCKPDKNGVYRIGERYINLKNYIDPTAIPPHTIECPVCKAYQCKPYNGICVVCGFDILRSNTQDFKKFSEENKEKIKILIDTYGR